MTPAQRVVADVSNDTGIAVAEILGKSRLGPVVKARRETMRRLYVDRKHNTPAIAEMFKMRAHCVRHHLMAAGVTLGRRG